MQLRSGQVRVGPGLDCYAVDDGLSTTGCQRQAPKSICGGQPASGPTSALPQRYIHSAGIHTPEEETLLNELRGLLDVHDLGIQAGAYSASSLAKRLP